MKTIKLYLAIIALTFSFQFASAQAPSNPAQQTPETKTAAVKVKGVTCKNDLATIAGYVEKLKGVRACTAEKAGPTTTFQIKFNPNLVSEKEIFAAIEATPGCENPNDRPYKVKQ